MIMMSSADSTTRLYAISPKAAEHSTDGTQDQPYHIEHHGTGVDMTSDHMDRSLKTGLIRNGQSLKMNG